MKTQKGSRGIALISL